MERILVIDYGSQYNALIIRRCRDLGVYASIVSYKEDILKLSYINEVKGIILSGGPSSANSKDAFKLDKQIFSLNIPILGVCYGMQILAKELGGKVSENTNKEFGNTELSFNTDSLLFKGVTQNNVFMSHNDSVTILPDGFEVIASSKCNQIEAMQNVSKNIYCLQFHPEVRNTLDGNKIISNFLFNIVKIKKEWNIDNFIEEKVQEIKNEVGNEKVILGISGGVDSTVAAALIYKAIGSNLYPVFINHGLLRKNEENEVLDRFQRLLKINVIYRDASDLFLSRLSGVRKPEAKRKIIGKTFVDVFKEEANKLTDITFLAQGTLYTDKVESGKGGESQVIKSHHNVGGLPKELGFKLLEPLDSLYKDEVRLLGKKLGLDEEFTSRQPFPGPGLAIRIVGDVNKKKLNLVKEADAILNEEIKKAGISSSIWQYFVALTNIKTVGVMGDRRTYDYACVIRAVTSIDGMTADFYHFDFDLLGKIANRIVNEVNGINKVFYDVTSKPPSTIELE